MYIWCNVTLMDCTLVLYDNKYKESEKIGTESNQGGKKLNHSTRKEEGLNSMSCI